MKEKLDIEVNVDGIEDATEKMESLSDAIGAFPANVMIKNCRNCTIKIYPSQTMIVDREGGD